MACGQIPVSYTQGLATLKSTDYCCCCCCHHHHCLILPPHHSQNPSEPHTPSHAEAAHSPPLLDQHLHWHLVSFFAFDNSPSANSGFFGTFIPLVSLANTLAASHSTNSAACATRCSSINLFHSVSPSSHFSIAGFLALFSTQQSSFSQASRL